jgi:large repetitive protein
VPMAAVVAAISVLVTGALVWPGLDAQQASRTDALVWILQTGSGQRYARVNTDLAELDTVRQVKNATTVAQTGQNAYIVADGAARVAQIDQSQPKDLTADTLAQTPATPAGTVQVAQAGNFIAFRASSGTVQFGQLDAMTALGQLRTDSRADAAPLVSLAIAVNADGVLTAYSATEQRVVRYDIAANRELSSTSINGGPTDAGVQITGSGDHWLVLSGDGKRCWVSGQNDPVNLETTGTTVVQRATVGGDGFAVADSLGLYNVDFAGRATRTYQPGSSLGTPAAPVISGNELLAAWLPKTGSGSLWRSSGAVSLDYAGASLDEDAAPQFMFTGDRAVLNDTKSGWAWTMPDGKLVPSSQDWKLVDQQQEKSTEEGSPVETSEQKPPVAVADSFGVRAGALVNLPVLLNDYDPNPDVLTIDPTVRDSDLGSFGSLVVTDNNQRLAVQVAAGATGSVSFSYRVSDGTADDGRYSNTARVQLSVESGNSAPECDSICQAQWPSPEVAAGGTIKVPILNAWVDPEGDQLLVSGATSDSESVSVAADPEGYVVVQSHGSTAEQTVGVEVQVSDALGATATKHLDVKVTSAPKISAESFAATAVVGQPATIDVGPYVLGTIGKLSISDVRTTGDGKATFGSGGTSFTFQSPSTGVRLLTYTVTDGTTKATAQVRVTISDAASSRFATPAVVAFVRPNEDATVDVLKAVDNPTGRVLLVSEASAEPAKDASLSVDIVGQQYLRVTGTTGSGAAGKLGVVKYLISDGQEGTAEGQATIYLLPPAQQVAPIAVDDVVTVRAGAQLDIPVTSNDIAAMGSSLRVDPRTVSVTDQNALAFASGNVIRTLAPSAPGHYQISYGVYSSGNPRLVSDATVKVTVLANTDNRAPAPQTLSGRVFSGQSTTIGFDDFGIDPDGDAVRLQRILTQPATGSAAISADGTGIVYTSAPGAAGGQVEFTYQVVDSYGATGVGVVRVGVLNQQASPAPITYTDYADVQVGAQNKVRISPLANDIDPNGGALTITAVRPNAEEKLSDGSSNPEYQRLAAQIEESSGPVVVIKAGDAAGTLSFRYDVRSDSGNTASGLIVVRVVAEEVPNYPEVADTVLTAETREQFPTGVDVVTNKATWAGGDATRLQLSLWSGDKGSYATAVAANGWSLSGELPDNSRIIPFQVTATAADGSPLKTADGKVVSTYAFLHVPGRNDMQLTLRSDVTAQVVNENQSVSFDMDALVAKPSGSKLEIGDGVAASKARLQGSCRLVSGTTVEYSAGNGSPWADSCIVPVRLAGQADFTYLAVPIKVNPGAPQPVLKPGSVTVSPGETKTYDLAQMTSWDGASDQASVQYSLGSAVADFDVSLNGQQLTIVGKDSAVSGRDDKLMISITSHQGVQPAALNLRVGPVPSQLPAGASVSTSCSQASGSNCVVPVTGVNGETNPFPNSPLKLVSVAATGGCSQVSFSVASDSAVGVRWNAGASGGTCTASFVVKDAQGRTSAGGRNGTLTVELLGYPEAPDSVYQSAYTGDSVTLRVRPGAARSAHPAVTGFVVRQGGAKVADCDADGACPSISAPLGEARTYEVTSKNSVGESKTSVQVSAWAYTAPPAPADVTAEPIVTDGDGDLVQLTISGIDTSQTGSLRITSAAGNKETVAVSGPTMTTRFDVGSNEATKVTVTPVSLYQNPPDLEGSTTGESKSVMTNGIGQPTGLSLSVKATVLNDTTTQLTATGSAKQNGDGSEVRYGFSINGGCAAQDADTTGTFDVEAGKTYEVTMCAASYYNNTNYGASSVTKSANAVQDPAAPTGYTFVVNSKSTGSDANPQWVVTAKPTSSESPPTNNVAVFSVPDGWGQAGYADKYKVRYCHKDWGQCGDWGSVQARSGSAPYQVQAELSVTKCVVGTQPTLYQGSTSGDATITVEYGNATYTVDGNTVGDTNNKVPDGATAISIPVKLAWPASWGLTSRTSTITGSCSS